MLETIKTNAIILLSKVGGSGVLKDETDIGSEANKMLANIFSLIQKFAIAGGALWALWGMIQLGTALKDKNGPDMKNSIWQIVGGAMIVAAGILFGEFPKWFGWNA